MNIPMPILNSSVVEYFGLNIESHATLLNSLLDRKDKSKINLKTISDNLRSRFTMSLQIYIEECRDVISKQKTNFKPLITFTIRLFEILDELMYENYINKEMNFFNGNKRCYHYYSEEYYRALYELYGRSYIETMNTLDSEIFLENLDKKLQITKA